MEYLDDALAAVAFWAGSVLRAMAKTVPVGDEHLGAKGTLTVKEMPLPAPALVAKWTGAEKGMA